MDGQYNTLGPVKFPQAGTYELCYSADNGKTWAGTLFANATVLVVGMWCFSSGVLLRCPQRTGRSNASTAHPKKRSHPVSGPTEMHALGRSFSGECASHK